MKLSCYLEAYQFFSGKASDVVRQLAFAGIAMVWIFKQDSKPLPIIPKELLWPSILLVSSLAADLLHYVVGTITWGFFHRWHEKRKNEDDPELKANPKLNWPTNLLFYAKIIFIIVAYALIIKFIYNYWKFLL